MALSWEEFTATSGQTTVAVNIAYLDKGDIHLELNDTEVAGFTWASDTLINIPSTVTVAAGDKLAIVRKTDRAELRILFSEGAAFDRENLDEQNDQFLYLAQELVEGRSIDGFYGDISMNDYRITDLGAPTADTDAANKGYVDAEVNEALAEAAANLAEDFKRTIRTGSEIAELTALRPNRLLGFDAQGNPTTYSAATGSALALAQALGSTNEGAGASLVMTEEGEDLESAYRRSVQELGNYEDGPLTLTRYTQEIRYAGVKYYLKASAALPYTTTGNDAESWIADSINFEEVGKHLLDVTTGSSPMEPGKVAELEFGDDTQSGKLQVGYNGVLKVGAKVDGVTTAEHMTVPFVANTGNVIKTSAGAFAEKQLYLVSHNFEDLHTAPSIGITYTATGLPEVAFINPQPSLAGTWPWPNAQNAGVSHRVLAFKDFTEATYAKAPSYLNQVSSLRYIQIAKWKVSTTPWNTEYKAMLIGSNTDDRFIGSVVVEADIQASGTLFATTANVTLANVSKYLLVKTDGPSDRIPYPGSISSSTPSYGVSADGTYLYLWAVVPSGLSSVKLTEIHKGTGSALSTDYSAGTVSTSAPSNFVPIPMHADYNGNNASMANDGRILSTDNHVRVCNSSGSYTTRPDIQKDGFLWGGYGTYKSNRQDCVITKTGTGTYVITGPHVGTGWTLTQPYDGTGQQVAIAQLSSSADGLTNTLSVYSIVYTLNTTTNQVTRGIGSLMDIPDGAWVDMHASTTF